MATKKAALCGETWNPAPLGMFAATVDASTQTTATPTMATATTVTPTAIVPIHASQAQSNVWEVLTNCAKPTAQVVTNGAKPKLVRPVKPARMENANPALVKTNAVWGISDVSVSSIKSVRR